jgi:hypothetical protein
VTAGSYFLKAGRSQLGALPPFGEGMSPKSRFFRHPSSGSGKLELGSSDKLFLLPFHTLQLFDQSPSVPILIPRHSRANSPVSQACRPRTRITTTHTYPVSHYESPTPVSRAAEWVHALTMSYGCDFNWFFSMMQPRRATAPRPVKAVTNPDPSPVKSS